MAALDPRGASGRRSLAEVKGARALKPRGLAVLRELHAWREERAAARDVPGFKVLSTEGLLALAEKAPRTPEELRPVRGLPPFVRADPRDLLGAIARALAVPNEALPSLPKSPRRPAVADLPEAARDRAAGLAQGRREAERLRIDVSVVLPQRLIDKLTEAAPADPQELAATPGLRRWRIEAFGLSLLQALRTA